MSVVYSLLDAVRRPPTIAAGIAVLVGFSAVGGYQLGGNGKVPEQDLVTLRNEVTSARTTDTTDTTETDALKAQLADAQAQVTAAEKERDDALADRAKALTATRTTTPTPSATPTVTATPTPSVSTPAALYAGKLIVTQSVSVSDVEDLAAARKNCFSIADRQIQVLGGNTLAAIGNVIKVKLAAVVVQDKILVRKCEFTYSTGALGTAAVFTVRVVPTQSTGATPTPFVTRSFPAADLKSGTFPSIAYATTAS